MQYFFFLGGGGGGGGGGMNRTCWVVWTVFESYSVQHSLLLSGCLSNTRRYLAGS